MATRPRRTKAPGGDGTAIGEQFAPIVEHDDTVAQQAPALPGLIRHHPRGHAIRCQCVWTLGLVLAHIVLRHCELSV